MLENENFCKKHKLNFPKTTDAVEHKLVKRPTVTTESLEKLISAQTQHTKYKILRNTATSASL